MKFGAFSGQLDAEFNPFTDEYLGEILQAVAIAWARMKQPKSSEIEDRITFRLAGRLLNDPLFRNLPYDIVPQYWLLGLDGRRLGRLDLPTRRIPAQTPHRIRFGWNTPWGNATRSCLSRATLVPPVAAGAAPAEGWRVDC